MIPPGAGPNARNGGNFMKHKTHRLLSLLIALALLCTLAPTALAANYLNLNPTQTGTTASVSGSSTIYYMGSTATFSVSPSLLNEFNNPISANFTYYWTLNNVSLTTTSLSADQRYATLITSQLPETGSYALTCSVTATPTDPTIAAVTNSVTWYVARGSANSYGDISVSATVYDTSVYSLGDYDDAGGTSIISQIENKSQAKRS